jgi:hypothetical protein
MTLGCEDVSVARTHRKLCPTLPAYEFLGPRRFAI